MKKGAWISGGMVVLLAAGLACWSAFGKHVPAPRDIPVLMYHNIVPEEGNLSIWHVSLEEFAWQMDQLEEAGFTPILPEDIARAAAGRGRLPKKPIVLTFDDGYTGVQDYAEPILAKHGFKAICYVIVGRIGGEGDDRAVFEWGPLMSVREVTEMAKRGVIAIGSHSLKHGKGPPAWRATEIGPSRAELLRLTGVDTRSYCFPFGLCGYPCLEEALRNNEYTTAMACKDEMFRFGTDTNLYAIPRVSVYGGNHDLTLEGVDAGRGEVVFRNPGDKMLLRAVVRDKATGQSWTSEVHTVSGQNPTAFAFPPEALAGEREIEAWDKFGIFRYYPKP
jgi:peptidoglycan/xylan/chitin deacetylase (PgdA/CDA1 family)